MKLKLFYEDAGHNPVIGRVLQRRKVVIGDDGGIERYQRYVANTLSFIAPTAKDCDRILSMIRDIENAQEEIIEVEGNDTTLILSKVGVQVDITINDDWVGQPEGRFCLEQIKKAIAAWRDFLKLPKSLDSEVVVDL